MSPVADRSLEKGTTTQAQNSNPEKLDPSDPRVKKLVYNLYRDMLTNYSDEASAYIGTQDPASVTKDCGVLPIIQNILRGGGSNSDSGSGSGSGSTAIPSAPQGGPSPPPPPMAPPNGAIPAVRLTSEIGPREKGQMPAALAGAMMKDKKPFTYTPGGIDLSEIRSPRMAKRLQMNAAAEGVTSAPKQAGDPPKPPPTHGPLPPAALAAMQGQMAFCVFPQGAPPPQPPHHKHNKHIDCSDGGGGQSNGNGPPPPPMQMQMQREPGSQFQIPQPPPPPPPSSQHIAASKGQPRQFSPPPQTGGMHPIAAMIQQNQLKKQQKQQYDDYEQTQAPPSHFHPQPQPPPAPAPTTAQFIPNNAVNVGSIYIQPLSPPIQPQQQRQPSPPPPQRNHPQYQRQHQTKAQAASQNLGSIYIPPVTSSVDPNQSNSGSGGGGLVFTSIPSTASSSGGGTAPTPTRGPLQQGTLPTPQLKKTPTPWMNSYNKMSTESPPYVNPGNISTPWGTLGSAPPAPPPGMVYTIPISISARDQGQGGQGQEGQTFVPTATPTSPEQSKAKAAQHLGRVIPIQIQRQTSLNKEHQIQAQQEHGWPTPRTIPIQVESRSGVGGQNQNQSQTKRGMGPQPQPGATKATTPKSSPYNNPVGLYSGQNVAEAFNQQQQGEQQMTSGLNNMSMDPQEREPTQSKSMRVIQKVAENADTTEPRFRGGHIPSKAFKTLQTTLPAQAGQTLSSGPDRVASPQPRLSKVQQGGSGPVMHNIPIQLASVSPTPDPPTSSPLPPSEHQRAPSPKKYMGANIPSRSFKMLQAMTAPDDPDAQVAASSSASSSPSDLMGSNIVGGDLMSPSMTPTPTPTSPSTCPSPCPPSYASWYYWWYYVTCYWAGYDMTGYDYPEGWDPANPYYPPELAATAATGQVDSYCDSDYANCTGGETEAETETEDDDHHPHHPANEKSESWSEYEDPQCNTAIIEEPSSSSSHHSCSEDSEATLVDEVGGLLSPSLLIEEYFSSSESESSNTVTLAPTKATNPTNIVQPTTANGGTGSKHFLSTIEELTDEDRSGGGSRGSTPRVLSDGEMMEEEEAEGLEPEVEEEEEEEISEEDEASSVSVIENKSASQSQQSVSLSKREDETSSSSSSSSSSESEGEPEVDVEEEEEEEEGDAPAVTVRLPLKLCFGKTKSYKDITTVLVGDVGVEAEEDAAEKIEEKVEEGKTDLPNEGIWEQEDEEDDEPVVSFTISLSRQISKEESKEVKVEEEEPEVKQNEEEEEEEVDFWSAIVGPSSKAKEDKTGHQGSVDFWGSSKVDEQIQDKEEEQEFQPVEDFWGVDSKNKASKTFEKEGPVLSTHLSLGKSPSFAKIGRSWDTEFNFWDKSLRTIETRRFSGNFEISEDYESDSGMKSDSGQKHRQKVKVKRHKRHSVPVGLPVFKGGRSGRGKSQPQQLQYHQEPFSFVWDEEKFERKSKSPETKVQDDVVEVEQVVDTTEHEEPEQEVPEELEEPEVSQIASSDDKNNSEKEEHNVPVVGVDLSVGWSSWDGWEVDKNTTGNDVEDFSSPDVDVQVSLPLYSLPVEKEEGEGETQPEEGEGDDDDYEYEYEYEVEEPEVKEEVVEQEEEDEQDEEEQEEEEVESEVKEEEVELEVEEEEDVEEEENCPQEKVKVPEEKLDSSEESSKSSGATVKGPVLPPEEATEENENTENNSDESFKSAKATNPVEKVVRFPEEDQDQHPTAIVDEVVEVPLKIMALPSSIKLEQVGDTKPTSATTTTSHTHTSGTPCTCHIDTQLSRAESLLWRIERFLHESLSLGSEDDSGVMTDLSRPISDVDTDPDPDEGGGGGGGSGGSLGGMSPRDSSDLLLSTTPTPAATTTTTPVVVTRRHPPPCPTSSRFLREQAASNRANPNQPDPAPAPSIQRRARPQSLIMLESSSSRAEFEEVSASLSTAAKTRSRSAERKRYQRAKTHSRLFQLLQDEYPTSSGGGEGEDGDEFFDCEQLLPCKTPLSFLEQEQEQEKMETFTSVTTATTTSTQLHVDTSTRRSRLLPLPLKGILLNSSSNPPNATSNSSPSGSSGVLSPTSPQTRDRLLADIINEFHLRQKSEMGRFSPSILGSGGGGGKRGGRFSKFPSKIFKLLQEEFGEEFYQTFELGEIGQQLSPGDLLAQAHLGGSCGHHQHHQECISTSSSCSIVKSDSAKSTTSTSSDFLEVPSIGGGVGLGGGGGVPLGGNVLRRRDFRRPKSPLKKSQ